MLAERLRHQARLENEMEEEANGRMEADAIEIVIWRTTENNDEQLRLEEGRLRTAHIVKDCDFRKKKLTASKKRLKPNTMPKNSHRSPMKNSNRRLITSREKKKSFTGCLSRNGVAEVPDKELARRFVLVEGRRVVSATSSTSFASNIKLAVKQGGPEINEPQPVQDEDKQDHDLEDDADPEEDQNLERAEVRGRGVKKRTRITQTQFFCSLMAYRLYCTRATFSPVDPHSTVHRGFLHQSRKQPDLVHQRKPRCF